jgi:tetratricopeptide (TPR) repeat protein
MQSGPGERYDFFLSRRGSVAAIAQEVEHVLAQKGYSVLTQDYDIPLASSFIEKMHEGVINSRDLIVLFTAEYLQSPYTRKEFTSFEADRAKTPEERHIIVLRCEDVPLRGLLADNVYQDLVGIKDPEERKRRIIAAAERQSQAAPLPPRPFIGVPPRIASFTGRTDELDRLDTTLVHDKPAAVTQASVGRAAVQGMGGVGKTSLAIEYAHRFRGLYAGVCWCPAETRTGLLSALAGLAVTMGAATTDETDVEKAAKAGLRRLAEQRATWLLVYDNVPAPNAIADLLPSAGARLLITSRFSDWSELAEEVPLDVLPLEEAVVFLQNRTARSDTAGAHALANALDNLPLALDHAAAYCKRTQMRFGDYAVKASSLIAAAPRGASYPRSVAATFDLAIAEAVAQSPAAEALMSYLAQCAPERIPMILVEGAVEDELGRMGALAALAEVSLLKHDRFEDNTPAVMVHRLVQAVARARLDANGSAEAIGHLIERLVAIYPEPRYDSWALCAHLTPHLLAGRDACPASLLDRAGDYLQSRAAYAQAEQLFRDALAIREKMLGTEHPETAASLVNLALAVHLRGDAGALPLCERALTIQEKVLGSEHPDTARTLGSLANLLRAQGSFLRALPLHERALAIYEKALGPEHPCTAGALNDVAYILTDKGDLAGALPLHERALAIYEKTLGPEHPDTADRLWSLASLFQSQGDFTKAIALYERALSIHEKMLGPEDPHNAMSLMNLAIALRNQGTPAQGLPLLERALGIWEKTLGDQDLNTNLARSTLARQLLASDRPTEALALSKTALAAHDKVLGRDHAWTKDSARITADALDALGRSEEAKPLREKYGLTKPEQPKPS